MNNKKVKKIDPVHIEAGIKKYEGIIDAHLQNLIKPGFCS